LSNRCRLKYDPPISRIFQSNFWRVFDVWHNTATPRNKVKLRAASTTTTSQADCKAFFLAAFALHTLSQFSKGQVISKGLFGFFNSSKKRTKYFYPSRLGQKLKLWSSFFGRIEDIKISF
jgi:hypothetical protein